MMSTPQLQISQNVTTQAVQTENVDVIRSVNLTMCLHAKTPAFTEDNTTESDHNDMEPEGGAVRPPVEAISPLPVENQAIRTLEPVQILIHKTEVLK